MLPTQFGGADRYLNGGSQDNFRSSELRRRYELVCAINMQLLTEFLRTMTRRLPSLVVFLIVTIQIVAQVPATGPEGSWQGTLDAGQKLRLALTLTKNPDGTYSGRVDSLDQGSTIPIDVITVTEDSVRLELKTVGAVFEGKLNADGSELTGQFSQGGAVLPLTFKRGPMATPAASPLPSATPQRPIDVPVDVAIPTSPVIFRGGGKTHLVYELHVTNFSRNACVFKRLEVVTPGAGKQLASYAGDELGSRIVRPGVGGSTTEEKLKLGSGLRLIVHLWLTFDAAADAPRSVQHKLTFKVGDYPEELFVTTTRAIVGKEPILIGPPLRGSEWLAGNGPSKVSKG